MHKTRIGHLKVELVLTDELRQALAELASGRTNTVVIPQATLRHVRVHHVHSEASRVRELQYRRVVVDHLELAGWQPTIMIG